MRLTATVVVLHLLVLSSQPSANVNASDQQAANTDGTTVAAEVTEETTYNSTGSDTDTAFVMNGTEASTLSGNDIANATTVEIISTTASPSTTTTPTTTTRKTTRSTTTTTTTTTTPAPPNWNLLPTERCLCKLDRSLSWAREQLIAQILLSELEATRPDTTTTSASVEGNVTYADDVESIATDAFATSDTNSTTTEDSDPTADTSNVTSAAVTESTVDGNRTTDVSTDGSDDTTTEGAPQERRRRKRDAETSTETIVTTDSEAEIQSSNSTEPCPDGICGNITEVTGLFTESSENTTATDSTNTTIAETTAAETTTAATTTTTTVTTTARATTTTKPARRFPPGVMASGRPRHLSLCDCPDRVEEVWGVIRILNMHWRTVLLYPENEIHRKATKYIHEQLDRIFRRAMGSWYATSEVVNMEEGSVIAHHKVYLTREVENITDLVQRSFEIGYRSGVSDIQIDNSSVVYYIPPEPPEKPADIVRYVTLVLAIGIMIAILFDTCWRTNACAVRSSYGYLEDPDAKPRMTVRERLAVMANQTKATSKVVANKTKIVAGSTYVATKNMAIKTKDVAMKTGRSMSDRDTFRRIGTLVATNAVWMKTVGALKKSKAGDQQPALDPEQGPEQQAEEMEKQLEGQPEPEEDTPGEAGDGSQESGEDVAAGEVPKETPEEGEQEEEADKEDAEKDAGESHPVEAAGDGTEGETPAEEAAADEAPAEETEDTQKE